MRPNNRFQPPLDRRGPMMLLEEMEKVAAFRSSNGECGWTREQIIDVIAILHG
jgi:hypothetical protein